MTVSSTARCDMPELSMEALGRYQDTLRQQLLERRKNLGVLQQSCKRHCLWLVFPLPSLLLRHCVSLRSSGVAAVLRVDR